MQTDLKDQIGGLIERGAKPVSMREVSERRPVRRPGRRRLIIGGVAGIAAAGCAAGVFFVPARSGGPVLVTGPSQPSVPAHSGTPSRPGTAFLTVAMVRRLSAASQSALANSGQERITYASARNGAVTRFGADVVTFSGKNWNYAVHLTVREPGSRPTVTDGAARVVNGQLYLQGEVNNPRSPWLHLVRQNGRAHFPEPLTVLQLLSPLAKFKVVGSDVIGGIRLEHLRATQVSGLPDNLTLSRYAPAGESVSALDLWADTAGVVHRMRIELKGRGGATTLTIAFSHFGQPEVITAPAHSIPSSG